MDDRPSRGRLIAEVVDVRHHVVAKPPFVFGGLVEIGIVEVRAQLGKCRAGDLEAELFLRFHEREPQPAPEIDATPLAPQRLHGGRGVPRGERGDPVQTAAFARATSVFQSARNCSSPRSVSGCFSSFLRTSGGSVATSAPIIAASTTWRGWRMDAARISVSIL